MIVVIAGLAAVCLPHLGVKRHVSTGPAHQTTGAEVNSLVISVAAVVGKGNEDAQRGVHVQIALRLGMIGRSMF